MSTDPSAKPNRVNDDILRLIFEQYALEESEDHRLETLLLVCRQWRDTLLDYHILWSRISILVGHRDTYDACIDQALSRLHRSGPTTPLDISIIKDLKGPCKFNAESSNYQLKSGNCCSDIPSRAISCILELLAGEDGTFCSRWRSLEIRHDASRGHNAYIVDGIYRPSMRALTYPTPSLVSVHLSWFTVNGPILPFTPNLSSLYIDNVDAPFSFDLGNALNITLAYSQQGMYPVRFAHIQSAIRVRKLVLDLPFYFSLSSSRSSPLALPLLEDLTLASYDEELPHLHTPKLKHLSLKLINTSLLSSLTDNCPGIPCDQVEHLTLNLHMEPLREVANELGSFLIQFTSLKRVDANSAASTLITRLAWESIREESLVVHPFHGREVFLHSFVGDKGLGEIMLSGKESAGDLEEYARRNDLPSPAGDWEAWDDELQLRQLRDLQISLELNDLCTIGYREAYMSARNEVDIGSVTFNEAQQICDNIIRPVELKICPPIKPVVPMHPPKESKPSRWKWLFRSKESSGI